MSWLNPLWLLTSFDPFWPFLNLLTLFDICWGGFFLHHPGSEPLWWCALQGCFTTFQIQQRIPVVWGKQSSVKRELKTWDGPTELISKFMKRWREKDCVEMRKMYQNILHTYLTCAMRYFLLFHMVQWPSLEWSVPGQSRTRAHWVQGWTRSLELHFQHFRHRFIDSERRNIVQWCPVGPDMSRF